MQPTPMSCPQSVKQRKYKEISETILILHLKPGKLLTFHQTINIQLTIYPFIFHPFIYHQLTNSLSWHWLQTRQNIENSNSEMPKNLISIIC